MTKKRIYLILFLGLWISVSLSAKDTEKIRGTRFIASPNYMGKPYLYDKFLLGSVEFTDGTKIDNIALSYSTYRDELIYYNSEISAQIMIDKTSLNGFTLTDGTGKHRIFRRMHSSGYSHDESYYEILSEGPVSLLVYRKVNLEPCDTYYSKSRMAYQPAYVYYLYSKEKGYSALNVSRNSLLSKFTKPNQKMIKKLLRKNGAIITDESSFIKAWNLIRECGVEIIF